MTANKRIILNVVVTYGRSLLAMICGIFTSRWALMALGEVDYGLFGVVGGLTVFIAFINGLLGASVSRYYAVSIGRSENSANMNESLHEEPRRWFSVAVLIHLVISCILMIVGYPVGMWAVKHFLAIPPDRVEACMAVFRWTCFSCFISMISVPFSAMYTAKQYIAELSLYTIVSLIVNIIALHWMVTHDGDWLSVYAIVVSIGSVLPSAIIMLRSRFVIPEARFSLRYALDFARVKELSRFTCWNALGGLGYLLRGQGVAILVNKCFGPSINASMAIANTVNAHASSLSQAMTGAFMPAIATACGRGDMDETRKLTFRACKFGVLMVLIFIIPLALELDSVLTFWLKNPPRYVYGLCLGMMILLIIEKSTIGHGVAIHAVGKIATYQLSSGLSLMLTIPLAWLGIVVFGSVYAVVGGMVIAMALVSIVRIILARKYVGISFRYWLFKIILPIVCVTVISLLIGLTLQLLLVRSLLRVALVSIATSGIFVLLMSFGVLDASERSYLRSVIKKFCGRNS